MDSNRKVAPKMDSRRTPQKMKASKNTTIDLQVVWYFVWFCVSLARVYWVQKWPKIIGLGKIYSFWVLLGFVICVCVGMFGSFFMGIFLKNGRQLHVVPWCDKFLVVCYGKMVPKKVENCSCFWFWGVCYIFGCFNLFGGLFVVIWGGLNPKWSTQKTTHPKTETKAQTIKSNAKQNKSKGPNNTPKSKQEHLCKNINTNAKT